MCGCCRVVVGARVEYIGVIANSICSTLIVIVGVAIIVVVFVVAVGVLCFVRCYLCCCFCCIVVVHIASTLCSLSVLVLLPLLFVLFV